jgi:hypothetical protein
MNEISTFSPTRNWYAVGPVVAHSGAVPLAFSTSAFTISLNQSATHTARPAATMSKRPRSTSFAYA